MRNEECLAKSHLRSEPDGTLGGLSGACTGVCKVRYGVEADHSLRLTPRTPSPQNYLTLTACSVNITRPTVRADAAALKLNDNGYSHPWVVMRQV